MSDSSGSSGHGGGRGSDDGSNVTLFHCKLCPGASFTAAEREIHRRVHLANLASSKKPRAGPKSRRARVPPPSSSIFTIEPRGAAPINSSSAESDEEEPPAKKTKKGPKAKARSGGGKKKIRSRKNYREDIDTSVKFTGA